MAFYHSAAFAGVLVANSSPFKDTGSTGTASIAAATTRFHVAHLAHTQDETYPIAGVTSEIQAVQDAGFPTVFVQRTGTHYDDAGDTVGSGPVPGTDTDIRTYLLPHIDDGWTSP